MRVSMGIAVGLLLLLIVGCGGGGGELVVGSIQGPDSVDEFSTGEYTVSASGDTGITYQWSVEPASAGTFTAPTSANTIFSAAEVPQDTPVQIRVSVKSDKSGPILVSRTVTVLDSLNLSDNLVDVDALPMTLVSINGSLYTFNYTGAPPEIHPGDVLMGSEGGGYLRKVEAVQDTGSSLVIDTSPATLEDAIEEGHLSAVLDFSHGGESWEQRAGAETFQYPPLVVSLSGLELFSDDEITIEIPEGEITFAPKIEIDIVVESRKLTYFLTTATGALDLSLDVLATADGDFDWDGEVLAHIYSAPFTIGPFSGAVVFDFYAGADLEGNIQDHIAAGFEYENEVALGAEYSAGIWQAIGEQNPQFSERPADGQSTGDVLLRGYVRPEVRVLLFNTVGTVIKAEPYLEFEGTGEEYPPCLTYDLTAGLTSDVYVFVEILSWELEDFSAQIFDWREQFFSGEIGDCSGGGGGYGNCEEMSKYEGNPVLTFGGEGEWDRYGSGPTSPCVVEVPPEFGEARLFMYYSVHSGDQVHKIGMASTDDPEGLTGWVRHPEPVLEPDPGQWDGRELWTPYVIYDDGPEVIFSGERFKMWYGGVGGSMGPGDIGYAESEDGIHWVKYEGNPVISHGEQPWWDSFRIMGPSVIGSGDVYYIYYWGAVTGAGSDTIGMAESTDGVNWTLHPDNPVFEPNTDPGAWDSVGVNSPSVLMYGDTMYMFYKGGGQSDHGIGLAWSADGVNWDRCDEPVIRTSYNAGDWDYGSLHGGMAMLTGDSTARVWYIARDSEDVPWQQSHDAIGVAEGAISGPPQMEFAYVSDRTGNYEIYLTDTYGSFEENLTNHPAVDYLCDFSPDGSILYFNSDRDGNFEVYALDMVTRELTNITHDPGTQYACAVSPAGDWILTVQSWSVIDKDIFRLRADGSMDRSEWINLTNTQGTYEHEMDWSPDGESVVYYRIDGSGNDIWMMDSLDGGNQHKVLAAPGDDHGPTFHPDGDRILYQSQRSAGNGIFYYSLSEGVDYTYIDSDSDEYGGEFSPDGRYVFFLIGEPADIYYASFPDLEPGEPIPLITGPSHDGMAVWRPGQ